MLQKGREHDGLHLPSQSLEVVVGSMYKRHREAIRRAYNTGGTACRVPTLKPVIATVCNTDKNLCFFLSSKL
jgi:hypothetical protein